MKRSHGNIHELCSLGIAVVQFSPLLASEVVFFFFQNAFTSTKEES